MSLSILFLSWPTHRNMQRYMDILSHYLKIVNMVVELVSIFMVNNLLWKWKKFAAKMPFHYNSRLRNTLSFKGNNLISTAYITSTIWISFHGYNITFVFLGVN